LMFTIFKIFIYWKILTLFIVL